MISKFMNKNTVKLRNQFHKYFMPFQFNKNQVSKSYLKKVN